MRSRPGVHYAPVSKGVYVSAAKGAFLLAGPASLFQLVDRLTPLLDRGATEDELVAAAGAEKTRGVVRWVAGQLLLRELLFDLDRLDTPEPGPDERAAYGDSLAYLETRSDDPYTAFRRVREGRAVVLGRGPAAESAARGLSAAGFGSVVLAGTDGSAPDPSELLLLDPELDRVVLPASAAEAAGLLSGACVAVVVDAAPSADATAELAPGAAIVPVTTADASRAGGPQVVGPLRTAGEAPGLHGRLVERAVIRQGDQARTVPSSTGAIMAGALAAHRAFQHIGLGTPESSVSVVHGPALETDEAVLAGTGQAEWSGIRSLGDADPSGLAPVVTEEVLTDSLPLFAPWTGPFRWIAPDDLPQLPSALAVLEGLTPDFGAPLVRRGIDHGSAAVQAILAGLRVLAAVPYPPGIRLLERSVSAAGTTEARWLLDGVLRILARSAAAPATVLGWDDITDHDTLRFWRTLEEYEDQPVVLTLGRPAGLAGPWCTVTVADARTGAVLGSAWGDSTDRAAGLALAAAHGARRAGQAGHPGTVDPAPGTELIDLITEPALNALAGDIEAYCHAHGVRPLGVRVVADPLAGEQKLCWGPVWLS
ncbi:hypothetical protein J5Y04_20990 [Kitasatospora sp. RG8]|uniref:hypothetical protein n=1 Tax=Kitasatospora sp. RG8 TaxID=2820815 RepID=UPI001ADFF813|nr:hypothetical protein [Kitasatospora sp. RG8]MBP0451996.1 hypothetical protein [Kitasatospora sp. RG8]